MPRGKVKKPAALAKRSADACLFCNSEEDNEEAYGKLLKKQDITIHYFCMLFSSGLWQRGKRERDGILGFMPADIYREQKRGNRLTCQYCRKKGATIGCVISNCRKTFHFRCGREAGGLSQFFQQFRSYCPDHRPCQDTPTSDRLAFYGTAKSTCSICMLSVEARASNDTLRSPCCRKAWFHRNCIQRYALSAGAYFFKCPLCNNKELFEAEMLEFGIYIPEQDAAWEQDPSAFQELLERYNRCDATDCQCSQGREHDGPPGSRWEIILCDCCGSSGSHTECRGLTKVNKEILCKECAEITAIVKNQKITKKCSAKSKAIPSPEQIRQQLQQHLSASLRAERAARRQAAASLDSSAVTRPSLRGCKQGTTESSSGPPAELPVQSTAAPQALNSCLANSLPVVFLEQAEMEFGIDGTQSAEESLETSSHRVAQLNGSDGQSSAVQTLVSSTGQVRRGSPRKRAALAQDSTPVEMTSGCAQEAGDPPDVNIRLVHDRSTAHRKRKLSGRQTPAPQDEALPADRKESPVKQTAVMESSSQCAPASPRKTPSKVTTREEKGRKNPAALALPGPSQLTQNIPPSTQRVSSPHTSDSQMESDSEHNAGACQASQQTALTLNNRMEEDERKGGKKFYQKRGIKVGSELCTNNMDKYYHRTVVSTASDQCTTRTQSFVCKRWTRSSLARSKPLKRNGVSLHQEVLNWRLVKEPDASACGETLKKLSKKSPESKSSLQHNEFRSRVCKPTKHKKHVHTKTRQVFLKGKLLEPGSDGNNNFSDEAEETNHQQPDCTSPRQLGRITRSGFSQGRFFHLHPDRTNSSHLLSDAADCPQSLPGQDQDSTGTLTEDNVQKDDMTTANDTSSTGTLGSSQVRSMDDIVQTPSQGFASVVDSNTADLVSKAKTLLSSGAGEMRSSSSCNMPISHVGGGSSSNLEDDFMSLLTQHAVQYEVMRHPSMDLFMPAQGYSIADSEAISLSSLLVREKQDHWLAKRKKKKRRKIITSRSPVKKSAGIAVCVREENAKCDVASVHEWDHSIASEPQQGIGRLFMPPIFESAPLIPHSFRSESLVQRSAYQVSLSQSPDHPDQVLLWNVQSQRPGAVAAAGGGYQPYAAEAFESVVHRARTVFSHVSTLLTE